MPISKDTSHQLTEEVVAIIEAGVDAELKDEAFNDYCMRMFEFQYETNKIFREFCDIKR